MRPPRSRASQRSGQRSSFLSMGKRRWSTQLNPPPSVWPNVVSFVAAERPSGIWSQSAWVRIQILPLPSRAFSGASHFFSPCWLPQSTERTPWTFPVVTPSLFGVRLAPSRGAGTERAQTLGACCAFVEGVWEPRMGASAFPKVHARMSSEDMNSTSGNFWDAKDPQSQTAGDARAPALRPPPPPAQENSEPWPGQPHPPGPIVTLDPCAVFQRAAHSGSLRRRAQLSTAEKRPRPTAPARGAVHFGTCSLPAALWELRFPCSPGAGTSASWSCKWVTSGQRDPDPKPDSSLRRWGVGWTARRWPVLSRMSASRPPAARRQLSGWGPGGGGPSRSPPAERPCLAPASSRRGIRPTLRRGRNV